MFSVHKLCEHRPIASGVACVTHVFVITLFYLEDYIYVSDFLGGFVETSELGEADVKGRS